MYSCSECGRSIGLMANKLGMPERFRCPRTGRLANVQMPIRIKVKSKPQPPDVLPPKRVRHADKSKDLRETTLDLRLNPR